MSTWAVREKFTFANTAACSTTKATWECCRAESSNWPSNPDPPAAMKICVIFNPAARGDKARALRKNLDLLAPECALKPTQSAGMARVLAAEAVRQGFETILAAGGHGNLNQVLNGIGD